MASLTPLSKGLIALVVVGSMASAVWHLGLKDWMAARTSDAAASTPASPAPMVAAPAVAPPAATAPPPAAVDAKAAAKLSMAENAELGRSLLERGKHAQARAHLEAAAQAGDGPSACHLGDMALKGQGGFSANSQQAAQWFQLAQTRGSICFASGQ